MVDHATEQNIIWANSDYAYLGSGYTFYDYTTIEKNSNSNSRVIVSRVLKDKDSQKIGVRKMAEVFTPWWLCNQMLDDVDERLFGRKNVFNICTEMGKVWQLTTEPIFKKQIH